MIAAFALVLLSAAPAGKCAPLPAKGQWFHVSVKNGPRPSEREPEPVPIRRPLVMAAPGGLLVLTPQSGGRYTLCSDTWEPIGPLVERAVDYGLPEPVVSEKELFFVGLASANDPFGFFARFELATNKWKPFPREGAPTPRFGQLQAFAGRRLLVLLGRDGIGGAAKRLEDGAAFDPATNKWTAMARPLHTVGFEAAVPIDDRLFIWPHGFLYDVRANTWAQASRVSMGRPYQATLEPVPGGVIAVGGSWVEGNVSRYVLATDAWKQAPTLKLEKPMTKGHHVVNGTPVLVGHPQPYQGSWAGPGARFYPAHSCQPSNQRIYWLAGEEWRSTAPPDVGACWLTLVTPDAVFMLRWPSPRPSGELVDGEVRAFDPRAGTWRRATVPAKNWPGSLGEVRWDGRAFWQWGGHTTVSHAVEGQCQNTPANSGCDPVVTSTVQRVDEGWRLEPLWEAVPQPG